jgi:hypothetical protein
MASPTAPALSYSNFAQYIAQTMYADATGSEPTIPNALATSSLDTAILTDPAKIDAFRASIAGQLNDQSGGPRFEDLSDRVADIIIDTTAQGAGTLEVHLIDPLWVIPQSGFIQADDTGYLLPVDVNFPTGTDCWWRLCQYRPDWSAGQTGPNLVLTFEDRIVSLLREVSPGNGGIQQGQPNQTLVEFMQMLVASANSLLKLKPKIALVPLISGLDPNAVLQVTQVPKNAEKKLKPTGLNAAIQALLANIDSHMLGAFPGSGSHSMSASEKQTAALYAQLQQLLADAADHQIGAFPSNLPAVLNPVPTANQGVGSGTSAALGPAAGQG